MQFFQEARQIFTRLRHPKSLPQDIGSAIGIDLDNSLKVENILDILTKASPLENKFTKYMPRSSAERAFSKAISKDRFMHSTIFCYHFKGWLEFELCFDEQDRLRRIYISHNFLKERYELSLAIL